MNKAGSLANRFRQVRGKGDDVVVRRFFDLIYAGNGKLCAALYLLQRVARNRAHLSVHFAHRDLHVQPFLEFGLFGPERAHLGQCVSIDHK